MLWGMVDAVVVGSGPNGLAAAVTIAEAGRTVVVLEAADELGGGLRSDELTLPGFLHDVCSAVHPFAASSPFFRSRPLGLDWVHPPVPLAHPLDGEEAVVLERSVIGTAEGLGGDGPAYRRLLGPFAERGLDLATDLLEGGLPRHPLLLARFGRRAAGSIQGLSERHLRGTPARALVAGIGAHAMLPLDRPATAGVALLLGALGHAVGWPIARRGSRALAAALTDRLRSLGGELQTGREVRALDELPARRAAILDLTPPAALRIAPELTRDLEGHRAGPAAFKVDWALDAPIPWRAQACTRAGTVHLGGTLEEIAEAEAKVAAGGVADRPFVLLSEPTRFDPTRAPENRHVAWAYCHVPNGSDEDMTERIEDQVERFAPGFRDRILARSTLGPADLERRNPNQAGGDIGGGEQGLLRMLAGRVPGSDPHATSVEGLYLASAATPPGPGVHGMCGARAARSALRKVLAAGTP